MHLIKTTRLNLFGSSAVRVLIFIISVILKIKNLTDGGDFSVNETESGNLKCMGISKTCQETVLYVTVVAVKVLNIRLFVSRCKLFKNDEIISSR